jgi:ornithine cyclodeaminase/alanine dehydrogenase-like protein (mu-crystallin family)
MRLLVLGAGDVHRLLPDRECADAMRAALIALARGEVDQPLRTIIRPPAASGLMALMPAYMAARADGAGGAGGQGATAGRGGQGAAGGRGGQGAAGGEGPAAYGLKAICIVPGNPAAGLDSHQGVVLLSSARTGEPLALLNASAVTEIRTAAVSAVATGLLARGDAAELAIIGTGVQARAHLLAIAAARPLASVRVAGRDPAKARRFAEDMRDRAGVPVTACDSAADAVAGAGIVVTATSSAEPVLRRDWLAPGTHINAVGACVPNARELDAETMAAAALFTDSRESVTSEAGDYLLAQAEGAIGPDHVKAEIGELLTGTAPGRSSDGEITIFESLGLAVEDLAAAWLAYRKAAELGAGTWVDF